MIQRSYTDRLYPTKPQAAVLTDMLGAFCDLYNTALQQRIEAYRRQRKTLRCLDQARELTAVRVVDKRLAHFSYSSAQQVLRRLDKAFTAVFRRLKTKAKAGFPRFQAKSRFDSAAFGIGDGLTIRKSKRLAITGVPGEIKVKRHRNLPVPAKIEPTIVSRSAGKWGVCFRSRCLTRRGNRVTVLRSASTSGSPKRTFGWVEAPCLWAWGQPILRRRRTDLGR